MPESSSPIATGQLFLFWSNGRPRKTESVSKYVFVIPEFDIDDWRIGFIQERYQRVMLACTEGQQFPGYRQVCAAVEFHSRVLVYHFYASFFFFGKSLLEVLA